MSSICWRARAVSCCCSAASALASETLGMEGMEGREQPARTRESVRADRGREERSSERLKSEGRDRGLGDKNCLGTITAYQAIASIKRAKFPVIPRKGR